MKKIAIFGIGGFGREVLTLINHINGLSNQYQFIGFFDDAYSKGDYVLSYEILGGVEDINNINEELAIVVAIGDPKTKKKIIEKINNSNIYFPTLIHPSVIIGNVNSVKIGKGCIITAHCILTTEIVINDFVILNLACTVGHDTNIGEFSSFMPSVNISGEVLIRKNVYVGTGAKIINQLEIGENTIIGAGAVVSKSLPSNCTAVGVPAKPIKIN
jgi:sugar O-acyltransferase (sialic acid O-acetyltransferase NeuD family)